MDPRSTEGKAQLTIDMQNISTAVDATGLCLFLTFGNTLSDLTPLVAAATGIDYSDEDLIRSGERIWNLERVWNMRAGLDASEDKLPRRMLEDPIPEGPAKGEVNKLAEMLPEYYRARGWSDDGRPTVKKLAELGIS
jgi:aldehyde:ferredoxin oxidoreductase